MQYFSLDDKNVVIKLWSQKPHKTNKKDNVIFIKYLKIIFKRYKNYPLKFISLYWVILIKYFCKVEKISDS